MVLFVQEQFVSLYRRCGGGELGESVHSFLTTSCDNDRLLNDICLFDVGTNNIEQLLRENGTT
jgi:hypothetical protein